MKWQCSLLSLVLFGSAGWAQERIGPPAGSATPLLPPGGVAEVLPDGSVPNSVADCCPAECGGFLTGNRKFPNFIGFMSNPLQAIEPRAVTQLWPLFLSSWVSPPGPLPSVNLALSERLSIGLNQGGFATSHFRKDRDGFLNLGGFMQYTVIEDVRDQFLCTAGLRWEAPTGESDVFQGHGPPYLAPYLTAGKEIGEFHVLGSIGYQFPAGPGEDTSSVLYGILHFDRRFFGWFYPLVEFNWSSLVRSREVGVNTFPRGFIDLGTFETEGRVFAVSPGFNMVLIQDRLELGAVYSTPMNTKRDFHFNTMLVKMVVRY
jgi:hypothetical protein